MIEKEKKFTKPPISESLQAAIDKTAENFFEGPPLEVSPEEEALIQRIIDEELDSFVSQRWPVTSKSGEIAIFIPSKGDLPKPQM